MDRKEAIKRTAMLMGGFAFAPSALGILQGCTPRAGIDRTSTLFSASQASLVYDLSDIIIPPGDTPGAADVGVPAFIEAMVSDIYDDDARKHFVTGLDAFNGLAVEKYEKNFTDLDPDVQLRFAADQNSLSLRSEHRGEPGIRFFLIIKELTLLGYFTSEAGATKTLQYLPVPGRYEGCVPLDKIGKAWAT